MQPVTMLLTDPSPCLRYLVLTELLRRPHDDPEVSELAPFRAADLLVAPLLALQRHDGSWDGEPLATSHALARLACAGFAASFEPIRRGAEFLFGCQASDGSWALTHRHGDVDTREHYSLIPLQTALPLRGLVLSGYGDDARAERAYEWLVAQRLPDGAWPTGIAAGNYGRVAGYRRLAHSRWGCRSNTTAALVCLAYHPTRRHGDAARRALDLLLGRETLEQSSLGFEVARLIGAEPTRGFLTFHARFDLALVLELCWLVGAGTDDERIARLVDFVVGLRGEHGLWRYRPQPQASRWVSYGLLRSLSRLQSTGDWVSLEPRTPFQAYPKRPRRF